MRRWQMFVVSGVLFAGIYLLRVAIADPGAGILFLTLIPIALLALELGVPGGLLGAVIAGALTFAWVGSMDIDLSTAGFLSRFTSYVVSGVGTGLLVEQRDRRERRLRELEAATERHQQALEVHETIVQQLSVAKMALEMDETERALTAVDDALKSTQAIVARGVDVDETLRTVAEAP